MKNKPTTVLVRERALVARINRRLSHDDRRIRGCHPGDHNYRDLGAWYEIDRLNGITEKKIDLEVYARALGVLKSYERVET
jgi:hypothetical protein